MKVAKVERESIAAPKSKPKVHRDCNITIGEGRVDLSGEGYGFIAIGIITNVNTSYSGSPYQLRVRVMRHVSKGRYTMEDWHIEF